MALARRTPSGVSALFAATLLWMGVLLAAPIVVAEGASRQSDRLSFRAAGAVYLFGRVICHQRPERSFHWHGVQLPVCARCFGLYAGAVVGAGIGWSTALRRRRSDRYKALTGDQEVRRFSETTRQPPDLLISCQPSRSPTSEIATLRRTKLVLAAAALPTLASVGLELSGIVVGSKSVRALMSVALGAAVAWVVSAAIAGKLR